MDRTDGYRKDLAFIHDDGFSAFSLDAALGLLKLFSRFPLPSPKIFELGCGSGRLAKFMLVNGFDVSGVDSSPAMVALAKRIAPRGKFIVGSVWGVPIPVSGVILSVGEVLNYRFRGGDGL